MCIRDSAVGDVNDSSARVADLNSRIGAAVESGRPIPDTLARQREQLVVSLARLTGATATSATPAGLDVAVAGRPLVLSLIHI